MLVLRQEREDEVGVKMRTVDEKEAREQSRGMFAPSRRAGATSKFKCAAPQNSRGPQGGTIRFYPCSRRPRQKQDSHHDSYRIRHMHGMEQQVVRM